MKVQIKEYAPADALKPFIVSYWEGTFCGDANATLYQKIIPHGYVDLILHFTNARCEVKIGSQWQQSAPFFLAGFWTAPFEIQFLDVVETFNIRLKPEALYYLFGIPAVEFFNKQENLENVFDASFTSLCLQLEELKTTDLRISLANDFLIKRLTKRKIGVPYLQLASDLIRDNSCDISVEQLSKEACISARQLEREFKKKLGLSPKTYMRIARLNTVQRVIMQKPGMNMAELSYQTGYADQAHFVKDFKSLTGELPSEYFSKPMY